MELHKTIHGAYAGTERLLESEWQLLGTAPDQYATARDLLETSPNWLTAIVPGTVAQSLAANRQWDIKQQQDFDAQDWWYVCRFTHEQSEPDINSLLRFKGLATLAEVWLNDTCILRSTNMFVEQLVDVGTVLQRENTLAICFRALNPVLAQRRARPRWKTKLVQQQQLRWIRTSLLGRIPGWTPPVAPVGPWKAIVLEVHHSPRISELKLQPTLEGTRGAVEFYCKVKTAIAIDTLFAQLLLDNQPYDLQVQTCDEGFTLSGSLQLDSPKLWWPHTHGEPELYTCELKLLADDARITLDCGQIGFRQIEIDQRDDGFNVSINGTAVFCRGACWTVNDIVSLHGDEAELEKSLHMARDAGMNMIRVGGTMLYESELFYRLCDRLGIMVWQDFMFANMDYPVDDEAFIASVNEEVRQQLQRWQQHPCFVVFCGNSEVEQQAAMLGMAPEIWRNTFFAETLPALCHQAMPAAGYVPSTPSGGTLPFHVGRRVTHYYGVGAYLRPLNDVRRAGVRFTPECLGFSNIPNDRQLNDLFDGQLPVCHHPLWKSRVPRDSGAGWDFEDVRDHYLKTLFDKDPVSLRSFDMPQYLALSRITTGEMMAQVYAEWRSSESRCGGGLVWFYKDLWPGAGWGILDSQGDAKACYRYLQRVWQPQTVLLTDEGLDGVHLHVINEKAAALECQIQLSLWRDGQILVARAEKNLQIAARSQQVLSSDELLQGFYDVTYAYRFGPPKHDAVVASLLDAAGELLAEAVYFPGQRASRPRRDINLRAQAQLQSNGDYLLTLETDTLLQAVHFDVKGYFANQEYFHLVPGRQRKVCLKQNGETVKRFKGYVESLSLEEAVSIQILQA